MTVITQEFPAETAASPSENRAAPGDYVFGCSDHKGHEIWGILIGWDEDTQGPDETAPTSGKILHPIDEPPGYETLQARRIRLSKGYKRGAGIETLEERGFQRTKNGKFFYRPGEEHEVFAPPRGRSIEDVVLPEDARLT